MHTGFFTTTGLSVFVYRHWENGWYEAFAHALTGGCYVPSGRAFTVDGAIRDLERDIARAANEETCEDETNAT